MKTCFFFLVLLCTTFSSSAQCTLDVFFLYGSKPAKAYKQTESKWFGGILGGHAGIALDSSKTIDFVPKGKFHLVAHRKKIHSSFETHGHKQFWEFFGTPENEVKRCIVRIPLSKEQEQNFRKTAEEYMEKSPYDYAFLGMRCGAATYDLLAKAGVLKSKGKRATMFGIFYPRKVRKKLLKLAEEHKWEVIRQEGTDRRKWEKDR